MSHSLTVSIIGAGGYTGIELLRIALGHPGIVLRHLTSSSGTGQPISALYPHLTGVCDLPVTAMAAEDVAAASDAVFLALPHGQTQTVVPSILGKTSIVDLSGDFRLRDAGQYPRYYGAPHAYPSLLPSFVYGIPECYREKIAASTAVANPGCFAIATALALLPLKGHLASVAVSAITGSSGSGKTPKEQTHHPIRNHDVRSYKVGCHQHIPEILQTINLPEGHFSFVTASGPFTRGIHLTAFIRLTADEPLEVLQKRFRDFYADAPFVRVKRAVALAEVIGSNFCDIAVHRTTDTIVVQAVIDNLVKGAAGTAIQNFNLMHGFPETLGLSTLAPLYP